MACKYWKRPLHSNECSGYRCKPPNFLTKNLLMRKYQPIWEALKENNTASLVADLSSHPRIVQAVRKEKAKDKGWKLMQLDKNKHWKLYNKSEGNLLTFDLIEYFPITEASL